MYHVVLSLYFQKVVWCTVGSMLWAVHLLSCPKQNRNLQQLLAMQRNFSFVVVSRVRLKCDDIR